MKRALALPLLLLGLVIHSAAADAQSFHEKVEAKEIKKGGQVVGLRLKLTLRPENGSTQDKVRVSLGPMTPKPSGADYDWHRAAVSDPKKGYVIHQWPEIEIDPKKEKAKEVTLEVLYADVPGLKPGTDVEVISAWNAPSNRTYWHVWGLQSVMKDAKSVIKLPEPKAAAAKEAKETAAAEKPTAARTRKPRAASTKPRRRTMQQYRAMARRTAVKARGRMRRH
ncbi:MAG TPA: hypothetical protein VMZ28_10120 [Kofleriaceae bacterium]|nr:hypothetical protein [Kofleriaceae bacterium]